MLATVREHLTYVPRDPEASQTSDSIRERETQDEYSYAYAERYLEHKTDSSSMEDEYDDVMLPWDVAEGTNGHYESIVDVSRERAAPAQYSQLIVPLDIQENQV